MRRGSISTESSSPIASQRRSFKTSPRRPALRRTKRDHGAPMHLKSYQIDGRLLRTGAANFSASGLKRQDNDLIVIQSANAAAEFEREFDSRFAAGEALPSSAKQ